MGDVLKFPEPIRVPFCDGRGFGLMEFYSEREFRRFRGAIRRFGRTTTPELISKIQDAERRRREQPR